MCTCLINTYNMYVHKISEGKNMTLQEVFDYFKTPTFFTMKTGIHPNTWFDWKKKGYVPYRSQIKIEKATNGKLRARDLDI